MPRYDYRCSVCDEVFEQKRSMAEADIDVVCPAGHTDVRRLFPVFTAARTGASPGPAASAAPMGGGCGSACGCH